MSWLSIVEKTSTLINETIYIMPKCVMHLQGHWNKMVPFMNPSIFADFNNDIKFCNSTSSSINDTHNYYFLSLVSSL